MHDKTFIDSDKIEEKTMRDKTAFIYSDDFVKYDFGRFHPLNQVRIPLHYKLFREIGGFERSDIFLYEPRIFLYEPRIAADEELELVHSKQYIERIRKISLSGTGHLDGGDTPAFKGMYEAGKMAAGATLMAADLIMAGEVDYAWNPGGGFHHASREQASGFCIFNDVALAIQYLIEKYKISRVLYLDIDAHHADGVQEIFYSNPKVLTISFHESGKYIFPGTGFTEETGVGDAKGYSVNVPLQPYTSNKEYLYAFREIVPPLVDAFKPEVIIHQCGADAHFLDRLAHLGLTTTAYAEIAATMHFLAHKHSKGRYIATGGGGYSINATTRVWTVIVSVVSETAIPKEAPLAWREEYQRLTGERAPETILDQYTPTMKVSPSMRRSIFGHTKKVVERIKETIFPIHDIDQ
ncbi:MAG: acetoin utilization protein AcuC [Candidatus Hodarchaeota archaeon]